MNIKRLVVGELQENCYILEKNNKVVIIDPGDEFDKIVSNINFDVVGILITHHHFDHIGALKELEKKYNIKEGYCDDKFKYEVIKTPGHTSDSVTYYFKDDNVMFTGDFLFKDSIGRMDLPTGSVLDMKKSLDNMDKYSKDIIIFPGHGNSSYLGIELDNARYYF